VKATLRPPRLAVSTSGWGDGAQVAAPTREKFRNKRLFFLQKAKMLAGRPADAAAFWYG